MKKKIIVTVFDNHQYEGDWPPENAVEAISWFQEKINSIPVEFRDTAKIEIEGIESYDCSYVNIEITYTREETDAELATRKAHEYEAAERAKQRDLQKLAELKANT